MLREIFAFIWYLLYEKKSEKKSEEKRQLKNSHLMNLTRWEMHIFLIRKKCDAFAYVFLHLFFLLQIKNIRNGAAAAAAAVLNFIEAFVCKFQSVGFHQFQTIFRYSLLTFTRISI